MNIEEARSALEKLEDYLLSRDHPADVEDWLEVVATALELLEELVDSQPALNI